MATIQKIEPEMEGSSTIYDALSKAGYLLKRHTGDLGLEIETETIRAYDPPDLRFWNNVRDNSLRDFGIEYILKAPVSRGMETKLSLDEFKNRVSTKFPLKPDSFSTSVHVHLNFLNNTWRQMINFLVAYFLVENLLIRFSGPDRRSNLFCLPLCDAEGELPILQGMIRDIQALQYRKLNISPEQAKYAALNICNIVKLGTLEVRSMRGVTDIDVIQRWIDILLSIKDFAEEKGQNPLAIMNLVEKEGIEASVIRILGEENLREIDKTIEGGAKVRNALVEKNLWYSSKLAVAGKFESDMWGFPKPKRIFRTKYNERLDVWSNEFFKKPFNLLDFAMKNVVEEQLNRELNTTRLQGIVFAEGDQ